MNGLPYYKAYPRDFFEGTVGMDFEVKGAYRLILDLIYMHGGRLADDARFISGHLGCSTKKWFALRATLLAAGKITLIDNHLANHRADKLLDEARMFQAKQRENGAKGGKNKGLAEAVAEPKPSHTEPDTDKSSVAKATGAEAPPDPVKVMFDSGIAMLATGGMKPQAARVLIGKWRRDYGPEAVIVALGKAQREGAIDPVSFIEGSLRFAHKARASPGERKTLEDGREIEMAANGEWMEVRR